MNERNANLPTATTAAAKAADYKRKLRARRGHRRTQSSTTSDFSLLVALEKPKDNRRRGVKAQLFSGIDAESTQKTMEKQAQA